MYLDYLHYVPVIDGIVGFKIYYLVICFLFMSYVLYSPFPLHYLLL